MSANKKSRDGCCKRFSLKQCLFSLPISDVETGPLSIDEIDIMLNSNAIGVEVLNFMEMVIFSVWMFFGMVTGFAIYNGTNSANAVTHFGWWAFIELVVVWWGRGLGKYSLVISTNKSKLEMSAYEAINSLRYFTFVLILGMISNIVHASLTFCELSSKTSTFTIETYGFAVTFAVLLLVLVVIIQGFLLYRSFAYIASLEYVLKRNAALFDATQPTTTVTNAPTATPGVASPYEVETPFTFAKKHVSGSSKNKAT